MPPMTCAVLHPATAKPSGIGSNPSTAAHATLPSHVQRMGEHLLKGERVWMLVGPSLWRSRLWEIRDKQAGVYQLVFNMASLLGVISEIPS